MSLREEVGRLKGNLNEIKDTLTDHVKSNIAGLQDSVKDKMENLKENVLEKADELRENIKEKADELRENVKEKAENVQNMLTDFQHELNGASIFMIGALSLYLNAKLIYRVLTQHKREWLIINLAISNLLLTVMAFPFSGYSSFVHEWAFGDTMCKYYGSIALLFGYSILTTIPMIAIDEYLAFDWPPYFQKREKVQKWMILYSWLNTVFWSVTPLIGWSRISYESFGTSCTVVYHPNDGYTSYILMTTLFLYVVPIILIYICKNRYGTRLNELSGTTKSALALSSRTMLLLFAFIICWTPYTIIYLWPIFSETRVVSAQITALGPLFAKLSTVLTPMVLLYCADDNTIMKND